MSSTSLPDFPIIYLASASPRRHELLTQIGVEHEILRVPAPEGEDEPQLPGELGADYVRRTALEKAQNALAYVLQEGLLMRPILCADTCVILHGEVLGKPRDAIHAAKTLSQLSEQEHEVHTAIVLAHKGRIYEDVSISQVRMKRLSARDVAMYINSGQSDGKAGAYAIQGLASVFIEHISGSYSGIMGLPLFETWRMLQHCRS